MVTMLGQYEDTSMILHHQFTAVLGGVLENRASLVPSETFVDDVYSPFFSKIRDIYDTKLPDYFKRGELEEKELARRVVNDLLSDAYLGTEEGTKEILRLGARFGMPSRTIELGLASLLMEEWVEERLLTRNRKDNQLKYSQV